MKRKLGLGLLGILAILSMAAGTGEAPLGPAPDSIRIAAPAESALSAAPATSPAESTLQAPGDEKENGPGAVEKARRAASALKILTRVGGRLLGRWTLDLARNLGS